MKETQHVRGDILSQVSSSHENVSPYVLSRNFLEISPWVPSIYIFYVYDRINNIRKKINTQNKHKSIILVGVGDRISQASCSHENVSPYLLCRNLSDISHRIPCIYIIWCGNNIRQKINTEKKKINIQNERKCSC